MEAVGLNPEEVGGGVSQVLLGPPEMGDRCEPLAVVVQRTADGVACLSRWEPSAEERQALATGADVLLYVWGGQPPVALCVVAGEKG